MRRGKALARAEVGLVLRYDVLSVVGARLPLVIPAPGGPVRSPTPPYGGPLASVCASEWKSAQLHNAAQTRNGPTG